MCKKTLFLAKQKLEESAYKMEHIPRDTNMTLPFQLINNTAKQNAHFSLISLCIKEVAFVIIQ